MGDISKNFDRVEHTCQCGCGFDTVDVELNHILQNDLRDYYNKKVFISGGNRCPVWNEYIGGSEDSWHMEARAGDVKVQGVSPLAVYMYLDKKYPDKYGLGLYENFVHIDTRPTRARWDERS